MLVEDPGFVLLDEAVGNCRGREAYVPMTGPRGVEGVGFDVWGVRRCGGGGGGYIGAGGGGWGLFGGKMFGEWVFEGEGD